MGAAGRRQQGASSRAQAAGGVGAGLLLLQLATDTLPGSSSAATAILLTMPRPVCALLQVANGHRQPIREDLPESLRSLLNACMSGTPELRPR